MAGMKDEAGEVWSPAKSNKKNDEHGHTGCSVFLFVQQDSTCMAYLGFHGAVQGGEVSEELLAC